MNLFAEAAHSLYDIKSYAEFVKNGRWKTFLYGALISALYVLLAIVLPIEATVLSYGGMENIIREGTPDFTMKDNRLWVEEPVEYKQFVEYQGGVYMKADTDHAIVQEITDVDLLAFDYAIILDAENALVKTSGETLRLSYADLNLGNWDKEKVLDELLPYAQAGLMAFLLLSGCVSFVGFFVGALAVAVMGMAISSAFQFRMRFSELFRLAVHARTASILLKIIYAWAPFAILDFYLVNFGISAIYMWKAIHYIRWLREQESAPFA